MMRRVVILSAALLVVGCDVDRNTDCRWSSGHEGRELDLSSARDRRHLADDAQVAEDLAIRHADASRTPDWQRNVDEYRRVREECRARLNLIVAQQHAVPVESVAAAVVDRREWLDALVILGFAVLFALVAKQITRFMLRSALADSRALAMAMLLVAALLAGGIGLLAGGIWFGLIESVRVSNGHMSYRVERLPIRQNGLAMFTAYAALFAAVSAVQYRKRPS
ncbi:MAG TPA: hypothetical protein VL919_11890 [Vicinamibacterales bacterium]|nr:hypothetical protein [Vicinamibacterales bacterium]